MLNSKGPDYGKGNLCKHIIFILHRVLKVPRYSPLIYQQALITSELNEIFSKVDAQNSDSQILAEQSVREKRKEFIFILLFFFLHRFVKLIMLKQVIQMLF